MGHQLILATTVYWVMAYIYKSLNEDNIYSTGTYLMLCKLRINIIIYFGSFEPTLDLVCYNSSHPQLYFYQILMNAMNLHHVRIIKFVSIMLDLTFVNVIWVMSVILILELLVLVFTWVAKVCCVLVLYLKMYVRICTYN